MARADIPERRDAKADEIRQAITYSTPDDAISAISSTDVNIFDREGRTPIIHASIKCSIPVAEWLVANGANINHQDRNGWTALHFAVQENRQDMVGFLLKSGAAVGIRDSHGNSPLWGAVFNARGHYEIVNILLAHKADPTSKNNANRSPLDFATQIGDETLKLLLKGK